MKSEKDETSFANLNMNPVITNKTLLSPQQWTSKFKEIQAKHKKQKSSDKKRDSQFGKVISTTFNQFKSINEICQLCSTEQPKSQIESLCNCSHKYCFSCLNSYTISMIEDLSVVKCPNQGCNQLMVLSSNVYRYLPNSIKIKFLYNKNIFKVEKSNFQDKCQRCLSSKHPGECRYSLAPQFLQTSFKHRQCPKCQIEINLTSGKKKVTCQQCKFNLCYLCGVEWVDNHKCMQIDDIRKLQVQYGYQGLGCFKFCDCCNYGCQQSCVGCGDFYCKICGTCCIEEKFSETFFQCQYDTGPGCVLWNLCSIPCRAFLFLLIIAGGLCLCSLIFVVLIFWILSCLIGGAPVILCGLICSDQTSCGFRAALLLLFPVFYFYAFAIAVYQSHESPKSIIDEFLEGWCGVLESSWVELSPKRCNY